MDDRAGIAVLHVDDEPAFADMTADMLRRADDRFSVETATSASEGLAMLGDGRFDCVVSDYDMPEMDGISFLKHVRTEHPELPFILFTGKGGEEVASEAISAGVSDYLQKGGGTETFELLANRIDNAVAQAQTRRRLREQRRQLERLNEATRELMSAETTTEIAERGCAIARDVLDLPMNGIYVYEPEPDELVPVAATDEVSEVVGQPPVFGPGEGVTWRAYETGQPQVYEDVRESPEVYNPETPIRSEFHVPIGEHGVLIAGSTRVGDFTDADVTSAKILAANLEAAFDRAEREHHSERTATVLRTLVDNLPVGVLVEDADRTVLAANDRLGDVLELSATGSDLVGRDCAALAEECKTQFVDPDGFVSGIEKRIDRREVVRGETLTLRDGRTLERDYVPYALPEGEANLWLYRDVTEREQRAEHLEWNERWSRALAENLPNGAVLLFDADLRYQFAHGSIFSELDSDPEDYVGGHVSEVLDPETAAAKRELYEATLEGQARETEMTYRERTYRVYTIPLDDAQGEVVGGLVMTQDVTEAKKRERALERLHEATRELMTATAVEEVASIGSETATQVLDLPMNGVHLYDEDADELVPVAWADRSEDVLDDAPPALPVEDSLAGRVYRTGDPEFHADVREADGVYDAETPFRSDLLLPLGDHGVFVVTSTTVDDFDGTDERLAKVLAANIETALNRVRQHEALQRERDRLDEFASVVSHDLRSPLQVASGRLDLARQECNSDHLDDVADAHDRMDSLIEDLLALARSGRFAGDLAPVDLAATVEDCWPPVEEARAAGTLRVETDDVIRADSARLRQLLENLLRNAVEHGGDDVTVTVGDIDDGFYVADDGPGIPDDERESVFETDYSTAREGGGLGLNIVQRVAQAHGWRVRVTESESGGARFEITGVEDAQ